ncbi:MAG: hydrogenase maturation nickel metallochaperone HypA [Blautia sp.]|nr:hydrogenase maturation nickel metallochaperone HypA [Blautia sp.]
MHELSVVFYIIDKVEKVAVENNVEMISKVTLQLGEVSTVIPEYLTDCWKWARGKHDLLKEAELEIETIEALTYCEDCQSVYPTVEFGKTCPRCGSSSTWLKQGTEFLIKEIEAS